MKRIKFLVLGLMAMSLMLVGCKTDDAPKVVTYVEDGFYVVGEATAVADLLATDVDKALMAAGINEDDDQNVRQGMYEKYVALEGGKEFQLILKAGINETPYGATLALSEPLSGGEQPEIQVYKGRLAQNGAPLKVGKSGLYHIVVDVPLSTIIIAPVEWGVRGAMNSWGFTAFPAPAFDKKSMTYTLSNVTVEMAGGFKFAYGGGWKIELNTDGAPIVKANTNLGNNGGVDNDPPTAKLAPGGKNIGIDRAVWNIELTWTLAKGNDGFKVKLTKTGNLEPLPEYPENLYVIGSFVDWKWENDVISMIPVHSHPYAFWAITYFDANTEFKFAPVKAWNGDFGKSGDATDGIYAKGGDNIKVTTAGYYLVYVDLKKEEIFVGDPNVYLIGACSKDGKWDTGVADNKFSVGATGLTATTFGVGNLRMYATCPLATGVDWWQMEFAIFNGKIEYRGAGDDQAAVPVTSAGKKVILDFKTGTGRIE